MIPQVFLVLVSLFAPTEGTFIITSTRMTCHVTFKEISVGKGFSALIARKSCIAWFMHFTYMTLKTRFVLKNAIAVTAANILNFMRCKMNFQIVLSCECLKKWILVSLIGINISIISYLRANMTNYGLFGSM